MTKRNRLIILSLLTALLAASCSGAEQREGSITQIPSSASTPAQPVEYGATLGEWEEATKGEPIQTESSNSTIVKETIEPDGYPAQDIPQGAPSNDSYPAPELGETQPENGYPEPENDASAADVEVDEAAPEELGRITLYTLNDIIYQEITWDALVPADFTAAAIMAKYEDQLAKITDGSPEASELYAQMQAEFNSAPVNETMNGARVRLPGFIAPLEYTDDLITEFLLVPYFGACIHVPPPPANQTVLVKLAEGQGIKFGDSFSPFWVMGELTAQGATTELAEAGYLIEDGLMEPYSPSP